ncbi:MAG: FAD-dependent oxidoreductase [Thermoanaerobaculia bacterium]
MTGKPSATILGGGIAGLTAAHELVRRGFSVDVYERNPIAGGMARTKNAGPDGLSLPVEMGWRGYGAAYHNLFEIMREIPAGEGRTVRDNLKRLRCVNPANDDTTDTVNAILSLTSHTLTTRERWVVLNEVFRSFTSCNQRLEQRDDVSWSEAVYHRPAGLSEKGYKYAVHSLGPYLGYTSERCNVSGVTAFAERQLSVAPNFEFFQATAPTSEAWFDHWIADLRQRGVRFHFNARVVDIVPADETIESVVIHNGSGLQTIRSDHYVCALSIEAIAALVESRPHLNALRDLVPLAQRGHQIMLSVQYFLDRRVDLDYPYTVHGVYLPDSPWAIMIQAQAGAWEGNVDLPARSEGRVRDVWSVGICVTDRPGIRIRKSFVDCTPAEVEEEAWAQVLASEGLVAAARPEGGGTLRDVQVAGFYMWDSFAVTDGKLQSWEPRWTNNTGTLRLRPGNRTAFANLWLAGAYTRTDIEIYCMEGACESGRRAAAAIADGVQVRRHPRTMPLLFGPLRLLDRFLLSLGLPHAGTLTGGSVLLLILYIAACIAAIAWFLS